MMRFIATLTTTLSAALSATLPMRFLMACWRVLMAMEAKNHGLLAAGIAFYALFAIFPGFAALIALFGLVADPVVISDMIEQMRGVVPNGALGLLDSQIKTLIGARSNTLGWTTFVSLGIALWSARSGVAALIRGLNAVHERPNRGGFRHAMVALLLTLSLIGVALTALFVVVVTPVVLALLPWVNDYGWPVGAMRWGLMFVVLLSTLGILYRFAPNRRGKRPPWITLGAFVVIFLWLAASYGLSLYLGNFGRYNEVYGSIGAVIALLLWFYLSAWLVLMGAAVNVEVDRIRQNGSQNRGKS